MSAPGSPISRRAALAVMALWLLAALPLSTLGYGSDDDAWRVAGAAERIWAEKTYHKSRTTGFPLLEIAASPLVAAGGWRLTNLISVAAGLLFISGLLKLARKGEFRHPWTIIVTLAFLPVVLKNSTSTMDYMPALALFIWAYAFILEGKWTQAAVLVGLSAGFRPSSAMFVVPVCVYALASRKGIRPIIRFLAVSGIVGLMAYSPMLLRYGLPPSPALSLGLRQTVLVGGYRALTLFGILQSLVLAGVFAWLLVSGRLRSGLSPRALFHLSTIAVFTLLYIPMPYESEYLMPVVPAVLILLDSMTGRRAFAILCLFLLSYHAVQLEMMGGESGRRVIEPALWPGYTIRDIQHRRFMVSVREASDAYEPEGPTVLMFGGSWVPAANPLWTFDTGTRLFNRKGSELYIAKDTWEHDPAKLRAQGFRVLIYRHDKSIFVYQGMPGWQENSEMVDSLGDFFGVPIKGRMLTHIAPGKP